MAGVEAECDGGTIFSAKAAVRAEDKDFGVEYVDRVPAHADVLAEAEEVTGGLCEEHLGGDRKSTRGAGCVGRDGREFEAGALENGREGYVLNDGSPVWFVLSLRRGLQRPLKKRCLERLLKSVS